MSSPDKLFFGKPINPSFKKALSWSAAIHLLAALAAVGVRFNEPKKIPYAPVSVVNMTQKKPARKPEPSPPVKEKDSPPQKKPASSDNGKTMPKTPLLPKTAPPPAEKEVKINPNQNNGLTLAERIAALREKHGVETHESFEDEKKAEDEGQAKSSDIRERVEAIKMRVGQNDSQVFDDEKPSDAPAIQTKGGKSLLDEVRLKAYIDRLWKKINSHWTVPASLKNTELKVLIEAKIAADGKVLKAWIEETSGSHAFDDAALRTIWKSSPFPPPPDEIIQRGMGFMFSSDDQ